MPLSEAIHAWIEVDGLPLPEYNTQLDPRHRRITCFIPSEEGKKFCIRFQHVDPTRAATAFRGNIFLDGVPAGAGLLLSTDTHATTITGQTRWEGIESPFQFSKLKTTDDEEEACRDENRLRELGTVRLQVEWVEVLQQEAWRAPAAHTSANEPVLERSKKAGAHCASFGQVETARPKHWYSTRRIPFVEPTEFIFQYAPKAWLQAKEIIPPPPAARNKRGRDTTAESEESDSASVNILDDEEAAVYRRLKAKLAARHNPKRKKLVKSEPRDDSTSHFTPGEVIDLTGED